MRPLKWCYVLCCILTISGILCAEEQKSLPQTRRPVQNAVLENVTSYKDVVYAAVGERKLVLDLYIPKNAEKPMPLVVWIHGGAWSAGSKQPCSSLFLTRHGFAAASIGYRLVPEAIFPAQFHDCKAAIRYLRANADEYGIDPNAIGVWGASAGGHLAALLGTSAGIKEADGSLGEHTDVSSAVQAVCDWFGPSDFFTMPIGRRQFAKGEDPELHVLGGKISENQDMARLASPASHVSKHAPPFLIMHGDKDPLVPIQQSRLLHDKLTAAGVSSELIVLEGEGHGFRDNIAAIKPVLRFFTEQLKKKPVEKDKEDPDTENISKT